MTRTVIRDAAATALLVVLAACTVRPGDEPLGPGATGEIVESISARGARAMVTVPIRGIWDNTESPPAANPPAGCLIHIETSQTGHASHVGRFSGTGATCVTSQTQTDGPPFWDRDPAPPYAVMEFTNEMVWTAANGDELWLRPNGGLFVFSLSNGAASVRGRLTVAGGMGRFEGASGWMDVRGGRSPGEPADHLEYEGEITLKAGPAAGSD